MPASSHTIQRRVQFAETDAAGIVHFSEFFRSMEEAEHDFYRSLGFSVFPHEALPGEEVGWPRVHASCDYRAPLRFEEVFAVEVIVEAVRARSIRFQIGFWKGEGDGTACWRSVGRLAIACVRRDAETGKMGASEIPERIRGKIAPAPTESLLSNRNP
ncbi:MAG: thioesterase family protein [Verrucomicrobiales bacterium]